MENIKPIQNDGQLVIRPVDEQDDTAKGQDPIAVGSREISIPRSKVPEDALETRSAAVAVPPNLKINPPTSWLECTAENTANLTEDEIVELLHHKYPFTFVGENAKDFQSCSMEDLRDTNYDPDIRTGFFRFFKPNRLVYLSLFPDGGLIVHQLINGMSGNCLIKLIGKDKRASKAFMDLLFKQDYFAVDRREMSTANKVGDWIQAECESLPKEKVDELATVLFRSMTDVSTDEGKPRSIESKIRNIVDLVFSKLPPPNEENQKLWDNIRETIKHIVKKGYPDDKEKVKKLREKYPVFNLVLSGLEVEVSSKE
ncbi:MAG: hypothetical protein LBI47_03290 [Puniceicoccales bacterium]|nr:hypothetical protein [Puniceicoccales bacterium]